MVACSTNKFNSNKFRFPLPSRRRKALKKFLDIGKVHDDAYYLDKNNKYYRQIMDTVRNGSEESLYQYRKYFVRPIAEGICPTLTANMGQGGHNVPFVLDTGRLRKLTERECARLQGLGDRDFKFPPKVAKTHRYTQIGNTVTVPVVELLAKEAVTQLKRSRKA